MDVYRKANWGILELLGVYMEGEVVVVVKEGRSFGFQVPSWFYVILGCVLIMTSIDRDSEGIWEALGRKLKY